MPPVCPYCESPDLDWSADESVHQCRACGRSSLHGSISSEGAGEALAEADTSAGATSGREGLAPGAVLGGFAAGHGSRGRVRRAPGEVRSWPAAIGAVGVTILFYGFLALMPEMRLAELFTARGWVPYVITLVAAWALLLLGARLVQLRQERQALTRDLVVRGVDGQLGPEDVTRALAELPYRAAGVEDTFLVARIERALRHFESRQRVVEVVDYLAGESSADEGRVDASYALVRVFVWVVPTLGFIGTVIGIGAAVGGFSETLEAASSLEAMKESIGSVTGGLGVAFDTTLLALVMSILIMFPASAVQRIEENFLGDVEDYCAERLVRRMRDDTPEELDEGLIDALARRLVVAMGDVDRPES